jgi:hypothetical protein
MPPTPTTSWMVYRLTSVVPDANCPLRAGRPSGSNDWVMRCVSRDASLTCRFKNYQIIAHQKQELQPLIAQGPQEHRRDLARLLITRSTWWNKPGTGAQCGTAANLEPNFWLKSPALAAPPEMGHNTCDYAGTLPAITQAHYLRLRRHLACGYTGTIPS